jgi:AcrR family transcriptional regulator
MPKSNLSPRKNGFQDRAKDTVNFIIEATTQLLEEKGLKHLSTNKIVERAGISIGTLYQYFPNKESIIHHLVERLFNSMADDMVETINKLNLDGQNLKQAIELLLEQFFVKHQEKSGIFQQFLMSVVSVEHLKFMLKNDHKVTEALKNKFSPYLEELKIQDWDTTIFLILYALKGIQFGVLFGHQKPQAQLLKAEVTKLIYGYLTAGTSGAK